MDGSGSEKCFGSVVLWLAGRIKGDNVTGTINSREGQGNVPKNPFSVATPDIT